MQFYRLFSFFFLLMRRLPTRSTSTDTLFPDTTLFRSLHRAMHHRRLVRVDRGCPVEEVERRQHAVVGGPARQVAVEDRGGRRQAHRGRTRSEEHTSELQSLMRISYAVFCLPKKHI